MGYQVKTLGALALMASLGAAALGQIPQAPASSTTSTAVQLPDLSNVPQELRSPCPKPNYTPVGESPDRMESLFTAHKHYRLVIGAGEFQYNPEQNRSFVAPTAALIDDQLRKAGYEALQSVVDSVGTPYLVGPHATKTAIKDALAAMADKLKESDLGIIYYVGHGSLPPSNNDLMLAVYDRPVENDEGIRFTDIIGLLEVKQWRPTVKEIPHYIIVLETCYSGNVILPDNWLMSTINNLQRVARVEGGLISSIPPQIVIITATAPGIDTRAYDLHGANVSAFGYFFARALGEDWDCVDTNPDGILTVNELVVFLKNQLELAATLKPPAIEGRMVPQQSSREPLNFLAYSAAHHVVPGDRKQILKVLVQPEPNQVATVRFANGLSNLCFNSSPCLIPVSVSLEGEIHLSSRPISDPLAGAPSGGNVFKSFGNHLAAGLKGVFSATPAYAAERPAQKECVDCESTSAFVRRGSTTVSSLVKSRKQVVAGVSLQVK